MNAANILKPALSRGELQVIGATTLNEYRKHIEKIQQIDLLVQQLVGYVTLDYALGQTLGDGGFAHAGGQGGLSSGSYRSGGGHPVPGPI